jgi:hypothetical protein
LHTQFYAFNYCNVCQLFWCELERRFLGTKSATLFSTQHWNVMQFLILFSVKHNLSENLWEFRVKNAVDFMLTGSEFWTLKECKFESLLNHEACSTWVHMKIKRVMLMFPMKINMLIDKMEIGFCGLLQFLDLFVSS